MFPTGGRIYHFSSAILLLFVIMLLSLIYTVDRLQQCSPSPYFGDCFHFKENNFFLFSFGVGRKKALCTRQNSTFKTTEEKIYSY